MLPCVVSFVPDHFSETNCGPAPLAAEALLPNRKPKRATPRRAPVNTANNYEKTDEDNNGEEEEETFRNVVIDLNAAPTAVFAAQIDDNEQATTSDSFDSEDDLSVEPRILQTRIMPPSLKNGKIKARNSKMAISTRKYSIDE